MSLPNDGPSQSLADPLAGTSYRALGLLGRGGMGDVFDAEHILRGRRVVVKVLHESLAKSPAFIDRMRIEAQALGRLSHPNLTSVTDFGVTGNGHPYFVMERLEGRTLREEIKARGALPVAEALDIACQLLAALEHVHTRGLVHRDIKPDNLFLCNPALGRRTLKLLDFGIAKVVAARGAPSEAPRPLAVPTAEGMVLGTPRFLSPEQARGAAVDARADIYGVGIVLYCLLTGNDPFAHHRTLGDLIHAHVREMPLPPSRHAAQAIPEALDRAVLRALEKRPDDRFPTASAFAAELAAVAATGAEGSPALGETTEGELPTTLILKRTEGDKRRYLQTLIKLAVRIRGWLTLLLLSSAKPAKLARGAAAAIPVPAPAQPAGGAPPSPELPAAKAIEPTDPLPAAAAPYPRRPWPSSPGALEPAPARLAPGPSSGRARVVTTEPLSPPGVQALPFAKTASVRPIRRALTEPIDPLASAPSPTFAAATQREQEGAARAQTPPMGGPSGKRL